MEAVKEEREQNGISADRLLHLVIAGLVGFMAVTDMLRAGTGANSAELARLTAEVKGLSASVNELKDFARKPRFTHDDHNIAMATVNAALSRHETALAKRELWMREREAKEREMLYRIERAEERLQRRRKGNAAPRASSDFFQFP